MNYSLVIPCYNEERNIPELIERCNKLIEFGNGSVTVVLVNNGSTDNSAQVFEQALAKSIGYQYVHVPVNQGYGFGIIEGLKQCKGDIIGWTHADAQTDPVDVLAAMKFFERSGKNLFVKGRRYGRPFSDVFFTVGMSIFETLLLRVPLWDINAQPTLFSRSFFDAWEDPPRDFSLDLFAYYMAKNLGVPVKRFPVLFSKRAFGISSWNQGWKSKKKFIQRTLQFSVELKKRIGRENHSA